MCLNVALPLLPYGYVQNLIKKIPQKKPKTSFFCLFLNFAPPLLPDAGNLIQKILNVAPPLLPYVRNSIQKIPQKAKYHFFCLFPNVWNPSPGGVWVETFFSWKPLSRRCLRWDFYFFFWNLSPGGVCDDTFCCFFGTSLQEVSEPRLSFFFGASLQEVSETRLLFFLFFGTSLQVHVWAATVLVVFFTLIPNLSLQGSARAPRISTSDCTPPGSHCSSRACRRHSPSRSWAQSSRGHFFLPPPTATLRHPNVTTPNPKGHHPNFPHPQPSQHPHPTTPNPEPNPEPYPNPNPPNTATPQNCNFPARIFRTRPRFGKISSPVTAASTAGVLAALTLPRAMQGSELLP